MMSTQPFKDAFIKEHKNFIKANTDFKNDIGQFAKEERHASLLKRHEEIITKQEALLKMECAPGTAAQQRKNG
jgi:hypothetical protein